MGVGLGRNSPVKLTLGKDNYEALIERHGQWIRWRVASKCSCVQNGTMQPDVHCQICGGRGFTYSYQSNIYVYETVLLTGNSGILELTEENKKTSLVEVYDFNGKRYENAYKCGGYVYLNTETLPMKGTYFTVVLDKEILQKKELAIAEKLSGGFYRVPGLVSQKPNVEGVYYSAPSDIVGIVKIMDSNNRVYTAKEFRLDTFRIEPLTEKQTDPETGEEITVTIPIQEPVAVQNVSYIPPFIFALLNQNLNKMDLQAVEEISGDGIVTFPYGYNVSNDDILTVMAGSYTQKDVIPRTNYETDTIGVDFVYKINQCTGIVNGNIIEYKEGVDFVLIGTNKIKWLETSGTSYPAVGEAYSLTYTVLPTYKVVKQIPQLRTSENQRFPKKAIVKLCTTYAENTKQNRQEVNRLSIRGAL